MKKYLLLYILILTGCSSSNIEDPIIINLPESTPISEDIVQKKTVDNIIGSTVDNYNIDKDFSALDHVVVDHDLTKLSGTMSQAIFSDFMYEAHKYLNQTLKVEGLYYVASNPDNASEQFQGILIIDKTKCCQGYLDIKLLDGLSFPSAEEEIMIVGTLKIDENDIPYLEVSDILY